jgi:hypothetical protein
MKIKYCPSIKKDVVLFVLEWITKKIGLMDWWVWWFDGLT